MIKRLGLYLRFWFRPLRCSEPGCGMKCLSVQGLGRHRAMHARAKQAVLPLLPASGACPVKSSVTGADCLLPAGHDAHDASRFHQYPPPEVVGG